MAERHSLEVATRVFVGKEEVSHLGLNVETGKLNTCEGIGLGTASDTFDSNNVTRDNE